MDFAALTAQFDADDVQDHAEILRRERRMAVRRRARQHLADLLDSLEALGMVDELVRVEPVAASPAPAPQALQPGRELADPAPAMPPSAAEPGLVAVAHVPDTTELVEPEPVAAAAPAEPPRQLRVSEPFRPQGTNRARPRQQPTPEERERRRKEGLALRVAEARIPNKPFGGRPTLEEVGFAIATAE
jgi:hypothetical protein